MSYRCDNQAKAETIVGQGQYVSVTCHWKPCAYIFKNCRLNLSIWVYEELNVLVVIGSHAWCNVPIIYNPSTLRQKNAEGAGLKYHVFNLALSLQFAAF